MDGELLLNEEEGRGGEGKERREGGRIEEGGREEEEREREREGGRW